MPKRRRLGVVVAEIILRLSSAGATSTTVIFVFTATATTSTVIFATIVIDTARGPAWYQWDFGVYYYASKAHAAGLDLTPGVARRRPIRVAVSSSFGFGGQNSPLVFRRWEA
jgi:hypothetical protein